MKLVYVCSPLRGDIDDNLKKANRYCEYVAGCGHIPLAPHIAWQGFLQEDIPGNREKALAMGLKLIDYCSELWVCGDEISNGMQGEIDYAEKINKPVMYILKERIDENMKIRQNLEPLSISDCVAESHKENYENKILVLNSETLTAGARNAQNSLWISFGGFGCTYGARGQAVFAKNLFDGRTSQWERCDFLGVVKPESLHKWLEDCPVRNEKAYSYAKEAKAISDNFPLFNPDIFEIRSQMFGNTGGGFRVGTVEFYLPDIDKCVWVNCDNTGVSINSVDIIWNEENRNNLPSPDEYLLYNTDFRDKSPVGTYSWQKMIEEALMYTMKQEIAYSGSFSVPYLWLPCTVTDFQIKEYDGNMYADISSVNEAYTDVQSFDDELDDGHEP